MFIYFSLQESPGTIRNIFGNSSSGNLSNFEIRNSAISNTSNHKIQNVSLLDINDVSSQEMSKHVNTNAITEKRKCGQPKNNVLFFKMHKCSSSTVQNILMRYGDLHNLDMVLPPSGNYLSHDKFTSKVILKFPVEKYNIFCHHTRFDLKGKCLMNTTSSLS